MPRKVLPVEEATNDGSRALRVLLRRLTLGQLARQLKCAVSSVRKWALGARTPTAHWRAKMYEVLGVPLDSWERQREHVTTDYDEEGPATSRCRA